MILRRTLIASAITLMTTEAFAQVDYRLALPDARFAGFANTVNDFEIKSSQLALQKSTNSDVRAYATKMAEQYPKAVPSLTRNISEAGISMIPEDNITQIENNALTDLNNRTGKDFDKAYADYQVRVQTAAEAQFGAYSQNGESAPLKRYAQEIFPYTQSHLGLAKTLYAGFN